MSRARSTFCPGCGERKPARWRQFCTKTCAAIAASLLADAGNPDFACPDCGKVGCGTDDHDAAEAEESDEDYARRMARETPDGMPFA